MFINLNGYAYPLRSVVKMQSNIEAISKTDVWITSSLGSANLTVDMPIQKLTDLYNSLYEKSMGLSLVRVEHLLSVLLTIAGL